MKDHKGTISKTVKMGLHFVLFMLFYYVILFYNNKKDNKICMFSKLITGDININKIKKNVGNTKWKSVMQFRS